MRMIYSRYFSLLTTAKVTIALETRSPLVLSPVWTCDSTTISILPDFNIYDLQYRLSPLAGRNRLILNSTVKFRKNKSPFF